ncbi:MAG: bifunctional 3,4-dihydroxy-2-butanone-4-phosphate synthase/GTP cyclohydrolase II [Gammaproteobacteria bacterium CG11_big_fil_rev_8_21_14_0_20_46_22]|nr:MAG: bifunctional 3,4-dihydroxy-2-butanone-4-phosphate synthase/GTP cyclohydrolase II [Gammaproteobacteria bacterium CG12_big_fil_rev_8_21_14_0_65_46_12]PIR11733.1 MAG: bifunctional 3,4-dihydroxy-2-butanone-4-phosphate synthase/GTP cyclohydrolase II [Gammaproteobacteria bacterium CG11_big_fil_rev_8_21_14_0_20_46_22]
MNERLKRVENALAVLKEGGKVLLCDHESRENEGDVIVAAEFATPEAIQFMAQKACGLICLALDEQYIEKFRLNPMAPKNNSRHQTAFTVSIGARKGTTTGISAHDRSHTVLTVVDDASNPEDIVSPGHLFPLKAEKHGVFVREGHTEGSVDLMRLAGLKPAAVICEVMGEDGHMAKGDALVNFAKAHKLPVLSVADVLAYRLFHEARAEYIAQANLPTHEFGAFKVHAFKDRITGVDHLAIVAGELASIKKSLVRVHSSCVTGDIFSSQRCDCGEQLAVALDKIQAEGGVLLYLNQEGRGIGLANKIKAYALQEQGLDTIEANHQLGFPADMRSFSIAADMLKHLGVKKIALMTNNPRKLEELSDYGLEVVERVPLEIDAHENNKAYLKAKKQKLGHFLSRA